MAVSDWFSDEELISQLEMFFDDSDKIDFTQFLGLIEVVDEETRQIRIKGRVFQFNMILCNVVEVV